MEHSNCSDAGLGRTQQCHPDFWPGQWDGWWWLSLQMEMTGREEDLEGGVWELWEKNIISEEKWSQTLEGHPRGGVQPAVGHQSLKPSKEIQTGVINLWVICIKMAVEEDNFRLWVRRKVELQERNREGVPLRCERKKSNPERRKLEVGGGVGANWGQASPRRSGLLSSSTYYWAVTWDK